MIINLNIKKGAFWSLLALSCTPFVHSSTALFLGLLFSLLINNPYNNKSGRWGSLLLKASVIGLGFGINLGVMYDSGKSNLGISALFVLGGLIIGIGIAKFLKIDKITGILIAVGTAICGGSAIAAIGSILKADSNQLSISTGTVFLLNAIALVIFPSMGHYFGLSQEQFGTWAAIAIHDTSSVMGASIKYGDAALKVASVTKMLRILWIIPVSLFLVFGLKENRETFKVPMFIIGFIIACILHSFLQEYENIYEVLYAMSKQGLVASLFLVGSSISKSTLKSVGGKVLLQAVVLWIIVIISSLIYVKIK